MAKKQIYDKVLPHDTDLEEAILGGIMNNESIQSSIFNILQPECFYNKGNKVIFQAIKEMSEDDKPIDFLTVSNHLRETDKIEEAGGVYPLTVIYQKYSSIANIEFYAYVVFELFVKREMIILFQDETNKLFNRGTDMVDVYDRVTNRLEELLGTINNQQIKHIKISVDKTIDEIQNNSTGDNIPYIKTGIKLIDEYIYLSTKSIIGIAAPRGAGKTRYLIHLMKSIFENNDKDDIAALWYSMEDSDSKIIRLFAAPTVGLTDSQMQSKGYSLSKTEVEAITRTIHKFSSYSIDFVNNQDSMAKISRTFTQFLNKNPNKTCFLIIDNIMLIEDMYTDSNKSQTAIEDSIAASLRRIVNRADKRGQKAIIIFLHHMTKEMESRSNAEEAYRPKLSHMKGSTRFADIANAIILLNNPGMYKDLIKRHSAMPDIECYNSDGTTKLVKRSTLLKNMLISEVAKNRDGEMSDDNKAVHRDIVDFGLMTFNELKTKK